MDDVVTIVPRVPVPGMTVIPEFYGTDVWEILHGGFWAALVQWLSEQPKAREQFTVDTGLDIAKLVNRNPIDAMIDKATGYESKVIAEWCDWVTKNHWGVQP